MTESSRSKTIWCNHFKCIFYIYINPYFSGMNKIEYRQNKQIYDDYYINRMITHNIRIINNWKETETEIIKTEILKPDDVPAHSSCVMIYGTDNADIIITQYFSRLFGLWITSCLLSWCVIRFNKGVYCLTSKATWFIFNVVDWQVLELCKTLLPFQNILHPFYFDWIFYLGNSGLLIWRNILKISTFQNCQAKHEMDKIRTQEIPQLKNS